MHYHRSQYGKDPRSPQDQGPPSLFQIEILRCTFCGFCVEACPVDAIRLSSEDCLSDHAESDGRWIKTFSPSAPLSTTPMAFQARILNGIASIARCYFLQ